MGEAHGSWATSFVGRERALEALEDALARAPAVVVTGPPGVGKSRLVQRWARDRGAAVARADLGAAVDVSDALGRIARALALSFGPDVEPPAVVARVGEVLASRGAFALWLDDADAIHEGLEPSIAAWTAAAPDARVVVTSGASRGGTVRVPLGPLPHDEAVALLVDRARRVRPDFEASGAQRASLDALVEQVERLPLAIELIAPRLRLLSPRRLLARLEGGGGPGDALGEAIDRAFELLSPWERDALAQCTVFRDGFFVEGAEAVVDLRAHPAAPDVLTVLESLVDHSLLRTESVAELPDEVRLGFFRAVQARAAAALDEATRREAERRHAAWLVEEAERWDAGIESPEEVEHTARLVIELPNLTAAFERADDDRVRARLGLVLHLALQRRGPFSAHDALVERTAALAHALEDDRLIGRAELARGRALRWANDLDASRAALERAVAAAERAGDLPTEASCARNLAANAYREGDLDGFEAHLGRALEAASRSGRASDEVNARNGLGYLHAERGDVERARAELEAALKLALSTEIPGLIALSHASLSGTMLRAERFEAAERHATAALEAYETLGYLRQWALESLVRAEARLWADDLAGAHEDADAALERARWLAMNAPLARALGIRGKVAFFEQDFGVARDALEDAAGRLGPEHPEARRLWAYAGAARAMMGHDGGAEEAFTLTGDDELLPLMRGFAEVARARAAIARGEPADLSAPVGGAGTVERRRVAELLGAIRRDLGPVPQADGVRLEVKDAARWFRLEGDEPGVDLTRRRALRGVLKGLVDQRIRAPGEPLTLDEVLEAGWPGERMSPESGARRVYVTINRLRKLGLGDLLLTTGDGYMLATEVAVVQR